MLLSVTPDNAMPPAMIAVRVFICPRARWCRYRSCGLFETADVVSAAIARPFDGIVYCLEGELTITLLHSPGLSGLTPSASPSVSTVASATSSSSTASALDVAVPDLVFGAASAGRAARGVRSSFRPSASLGRFDDRHQPPSKHSAVSPGGGGSGGGNGRRALPQLPRPLPVAASRGASPVALACAGAGSARMSSEKGASVGKKRRRSPRRGFDAATGDDSDSDVDGAIDADEADEAGETGGGDHHPRKAADDGRLASRGSLSPRSRAGTGEDAKEDSEGEGNSSSSDSDRPGTRARSRSSTFDKELGSDAGSGSVSDMSFSEDDVEFVELPESAPDEAPGEAPDEAALEIAADVAEPKGGAEAASETSKEVAEEAASVESLPVLVMAKEEVPLRATSAENDQAAASVQDQGSEEKGFGRNGYDGSGGDDVPQSRKAAEADGVEAGNCNTIEGSTPTRTKVEDDGKHGAPVASVEAIISPAAVEVPRHDAASSGFGSGQGGDDASAGGGMGDGSSDAGDDARDGASDGGGLDGDGDAVLVGESVSRAESADLMREDPRGSAKWSRQHANAGGVSPETGSDVVEAHEAGNGGDQDPETAASFRSFVRAAPKIPQGGLLCSDGDVGDNEKENDDDEGEGDNGSALAALAQAAACRKFAEDDDVDHSDADNGAEGDGCDKDEDKNDEDGLDAAEEQDGRWQSMRKRQRRGSGGGLGASCDEGNGDDRADSDGAGGVKDALAGVVSLRSRRSNTATATTTKAVPTAAQSSLPPPSPPSGSLVLGRSSRRGPARGVLHGWGGGGRPLQVVFRLRDRRVVPLPPLHGSGRDDTEEEGEEEEEDEEEEEERKGDSEGFGKDGDADEYGGREGSHSRRGSNGFAASPGSFYGGGNGGGCARIGARGGKAPSSSLTLTLRACECCGQRHFGSHGSGRFCSRTCSNTHSSRARYFFFLSTTHISRARFKQMRE